MSLTPGDVFAFRNPGYHPRAGGKPKHPAGPLRGWVARGCDATVNDGIATVTGQTPKPFLGVTVAGDGPAVVSLRVRPAGAGAGRIEWVDPKSQPAAPQWVPFTLSATDWQEVTVTVPPAGPFGILRVYLPAGKQPVDVDWIEFRNGKQAAPRRWDF